MLSLLLTGEAYTITAKSSGLNTLYADSYLIEVAGVEPFLSVPLFPI